MKAKINEWETQRQREREREKRREDEEEARSSAQTPQGSCVCLQTFTKALPNDWRAKIRNVARATLK